MTLSKFELFIYSIYRFGSHLHQDSSYEWSLQLQFHYSNLSTFSDISDLLNIHAGKNSDEALLGTSVENCLDVFFDILQVLLFWEVDIFLHLTIGIKELEGVVI